MTKSHLHLVDDLENSDDAVNIRQTAHYCRSRLATANVAAAWLSIGQQLQTLRRVLKKKTPRGDNEHVGWHEAFKQRQANGKTEFPFGRTMADRYINAYEFFEATGVASKTFHQLPASFVALEAMAKLKMKPDQIEKAMQDGEITPFTDSGAIKKLVPSKQEPSSKLSKKERLAAVLKYLKKMEITLDDLNQAYGDRK